MRFGKILIGDNSVLGWMKACPFWSGMLKKGNLSESGTAYGRSI